MTFTSDELILALVSLVRETNPAMLRQEADGFTVDFEAIAAKKDLSADDRLLLKMRTVLDQTTGTASLDLHLNAAEGARLAATLSCLEKMQPWPPDVLDMSRSLRARLTAQP
jgi:hypothetical protein